MAKRHTKNSMRGYGELDQTRPRQRAEKRQAQRALRRATKGMSEEQAYEAISADPDLSDLATAAGRKIGNQTGPREQGLSKHEKKKKAYFGKDYIPPKKKEGPNIDAKARKSRRTIKDNARGTEIVEALLHAQAEHKGELKNEWALRAVHPKVAKNEALKAKAQQMESDGVPIERIPYYEDQVDAPKMTDDARDNLRKLSRHFNKSTDIGNIPEAAISKTGDAIILEHNWRKANGSPVTVSIPCMNNANRAGKGPDRKLNQQECEGIERITGYDPNDLVDDYMYGFEDDDIVYELTGNDI